MTRAAGTGRGRVLPGALLLTVALAPAPSPRATVARALDAIGGRAAAESLLAVSGEGFGHAWNLGQEQAPGGPLTPTGRFYAFTQDWAAGRSGWLGESRTSTVATVGQVLWPAGGVGRFNRATYPLPPASFATASRAVRLAPHRLLLLAADPASALAAIAPRAWEGRTLTGVALRTARDTAELWFDPGSGMLAGYSTRADDPILGVRETYTAFARWGAVAGTALRYPFESRQYVNGRLVAGYVLHAVRPGVTDSLLAMPDSLRAVAERRAAEPVAGPASASVTVTTLAPGVHHLTGGTHHSLAVEQGDALVLLEAPQSSERVRAVLGTLRARFPRERVTLVVNTHHHWDHAAGVRAALAAGLPVATARGNLAFLRGVAAARRVLAPAGVERAVPAPRLVPVDDSLVVGRGAGRLVLYRLDMSHVDGMLIGWLPGPGILFASDVAPGGSPADLRELATFLEAHGIAPATVAGGHGAVTPWAELRQAAGL